MSATHSCGAVERKRITDLFVGGKYSIDAIAGQIGRGHRFVKRVLVEAGLITARWRRNAVSTLPEEEEPPSGPPQAFQDSRFQSAMRRAIQRGLERVTEGVVVDYTSFRPAVFFPVLRTSGCSSAAGLCADHGDNTRFF